MAQQAINVGTTANDGTGDAIRSAFQKVNANDAELYAAVASNATAIAAKANASDVASALSAKVDTDDVTTALASKLDVPGAWTDYTPTVTPGSGSFTTASATGRWQKIGKTVIGSVKVTITTNGSAADYVRVTTPIAVRDNYSCLGRETAVNGNFVFCNAQSGGDFIIVLAAGGYPGADGAVLEFTFSYETI
jgi:hypothetical protein